MLQDPGTREVDREEAQMLADRNGFLFIETSAFTETNVSTAFETLLNAISEVRQRMQSTGKYNMEQ